MTQVPTIVDLSECLCDSPQFRAALEMNENDIDLLEGKLEKIVKLSGTAVESGKTFMSHQSNLLAGLWDLGSYFSDDSYITAVFNKLTHCLEEIGKYQSMLIDQTSRIMYRNLNTFLKNDIRQVRDTKQHFYKISYELDNVIARHAQVPRNKAGESGELENLLTATRSCFRHMALDYVAAISLFQSNKRHELLSMMLSFAHANSTFFHQGSDLFQDTDPYLKKLGSEIEAIREENSELNKTLENRHLLVGKDTAIVQSGKSGELLAGYLFKRTSNAFKTWNRRWFILHNEQLVYMKRSGEDSLTTMEEDLRLCTVKPLTESDRRFCFEVLSPTKHHILQAESEDTYNTWISSLQNAIGNALSRTVDGSDDARDHDKVSDGLDQSKSPNNPGDAEPARRKFSACGQIYKVPGNDVCCDCRTSKPEWASINLGVTLCIECSGIHRSLGVHFSKVRSMVLDAWEPETLKVFAELGNVLVNQVYEANFETSGTQRPAANSSRSEKEVWIRSKYVDKKFVQKSLLDPGFRETERLNSRRWSVRKLRRRPRSSDRRAKSRESRHVDVPRAAPSRPPEGGSPPSDDAPPDKDIIIFGEELEKQTLETGIQIDSDQDSTEGDSDEENTVTAEDISSLDPNNLLWKASFAHNLPIMCLALAMGADKNWGNPKHKGLTSLHQAVLSGSVMTCQYLILNGAKYNVQDDEGKTPLLWATSLGHVQQVCLLLKYRADQHICDNSGLAPLSAAVQNADADIVTLLRLATLDDEMRESEAGNPGDETFNAVVKDFSQRSPDNSAGKKRNLNNN